MLSCCCVQAAASDESKGDVKEGKEVKQESKHESKRGGKRVKVVFALSASPAVKCAHLFGHGFRRKLVRAQLVVHPDFAPR